MTAHTFQTFYGVTRVFFVPDRNPTHLMNDAPYHVEVHIQPSGAALIEYRDAGGIMSTYFDTLQRTGELTDKMYGGGSVFTMLPDEIAYLAVVINHLKIKDTTWDARYAPGSDFTGHDT